MACSLHEAALLVGGGGFLSGDVTRSGSRFGGAPTMVAGLPCSVFVAQ